LIVLHPGLKLEYFRQQKWEEDWIETAENLAREEYIDVYEKVAPAESREALVSNLYRSAAIFI
jgi:hypothetical protein